MFKNNLKCVLHSNCESVVRTELTQTHHRVQTLDLPADSQRVAQHGVALLAVESHRMAALSLGRQLFIAGTLN